LTKVLSAGVKDAAEPVAAVLAFMFRAAVVLATFVLSVLLVFAFSLREQLTNPIAAPRRTEKNMIRRILLAPP
jgi:hypothetical protein